tara:strand:+ start:13482 stop:14243 length:762 start_codon:yes stop_codon:yes gene_type:complete
MGKKKSKGGSQPSIYTLGAIKTFDFLGSVSRGFFGCILCIIFLMSPMILANPMVAGPLLVGFFICPMFFKFLSSTTIQMALSETWSLILQTMFWNITFLVLLVLCVKSIFYKLQLLGLGNPEKIKEVGLQAKECVQNIVSGVGGDMVTGAVGGVLNNPDAAAAMGNLNTLANVSKDVQTLSNVAANANPAGMAQAAQAAALNNAALQGTAVLNNAASQAIDTAALQGATALNNAAVQGVSSFGNAATTGPVSR